MRTILSLIAVTALFLSASPAISQQSCVPRDEALTQLEKKFDEQVLGRGLAAEGKLMIELFVSENGSWTMLASDPQGRSCVMASGENWCGLELVAGDPA